MPSLSIVVSEEARKKKPTSYFSLPDDEITRTTGKNPHQWFSFVKSCYYPIVIVNNRNDAINDPSLFLTMTIEMKEGTTVSVLDQTVLTTKPSKGIYWFGAVEPHVGGTYIITIYCENRKDINALTCTFTVPYSSEELELLELVKTVENEPKKKKMKHSSTPSKKGAMVEMESPSQSSSLTQQFDVLPYPKNSFLTAKGRLQRMKKSHTITGPVMQATLPASLVVALLDDKDSYRAYVDSKCGVFTAQNLKQDPTVNELLHRTQLRLHKVILDVESLIGTIRTSFEYAFDRAVLYEYEKQRFQGVLNDLKKQEICCADIFGGKYLLRYLVSMLSLSNVIEGGEEEEAGVKGSLQRRNAVHSKISKTKFQPLERVVHEIIKELDEHSHYIF